MGKLETLVVPEELGAWLERIRTGDSRAYFTTIDALHQHWHATLDLPLSKFIYENKKELIEVILGSREYRIEEPLYYALVKGHELILDSYKNLALHKGARSPLYISYKCPLDNKFVVKMTKAEWSELGVNDSNADFARVEE